MQSYVRRSYILQDDHYLLCLAKCSVFKVKAQWCLYRIPPVVTLVEMCIFPTYCTCAFSMILKMNKLTMLVFVTEWNRVLCEVGIDVRYIIQMNISLQRGNICILILETLRMNQRPGDGPRNVQYLCFFSSSSSPAYSASLEQTFTLKSCILLQLTTPYCAQLSGRFRKVPFALQCSVTVFCYKCGVRGLTAGLKCRIC